MKQILQYLKSGAMEVAEIPAPRAEFKAFIGRITSGGESLILIEELVNVTRASFAAVTSAREERTIVLADGRDHSAGA